MMIKNQEAGNSELPAEKGQLHRADKHRGSSTNENWKINDDYDDLKQSGETYIPLGVDETESVLAKTLNSMSLQERSQVLEDVHGVSKPIDETPAFLSKSLAALDEAIALEKTPLYENALMQNRKYLEDNAFRLMFLRSVSFNVASAATRLMSFLKQKALYFGEEKLTKEITLEDLSVDDMESLESGAIQVLPEKDTAGRGVLVVLPILRRYKSQLNFMRASFFVEMSLQRDQDVQKKGAVYIFYNTNPHRPGEAKLHGIVPMAQQHRLAMPVRYASFHACTHNRSGFAPVGITLSRRKQDLAKSNTHYGNDKECLLELKRFGIPVDCFPISDSGPEVQQHRDWVLREKAAQKKQQSELATYSSDVSTSSLPSHLSETQQHSGMESDSTGDIPHEKISLSGAPAPKSLDLSALARASEMAPNSIILPTLTDVVLGRGRWFQDFPGNVEFRKYLESCTDTYDKADRGGKIALTNTIVRTLKAGGTRFLRLSGSVNGDDVWEEASFKEVYKKVSQCYRTARKKEKT